MPDEEDAELQELAKIKDLARNGMAKEMYGDASAEVPGALQDEPEAGGAEGGVDNIPPEILQLILQKLKG